MQSILSFFLSIIMAFFSLFGLGGKSQTWTVAKSDIDSLNLTTYSYSMKTVNSLGVEKNRTFTGVRLKDYLAAKGVDLNALPNGATLTVKTTDIYSAPTFSRTLILDDRTLIAWQEDGKTIPLRLCPGSTTDTKYYVKNLKSITLKY